MTCGIYCICLLLVAFQRLTELLISRRNVAELLEMGGVEYGRRHFPAMVALHTAFLICCPLEVWLLDRPFIPWLAAVSIVLLVAAQLLRIWSIATLGVRWTVRVIVVPGLPLIDRGPYAWIRHPNYVAVVIEMLVIPLIHTAWLTATVFSLLGAALLVVRIRCEAAALSTVQHTPTAEFVR